MLISHTHRDTLHANTNKIVALDQTKIKVKLGYEAWIKLTDMETQDRVPILAYLFFKLYHPHHLFFKGLQWVQYCFLLMFLQIKKKLHPIHSELGTNQAHFFSSNISSFWNSDIFITVPLGVILPIETI